jgi:hypothetical protein
MFNYSTEYSLSLKAYKDKCYESINWYYVHSIIDFTLSFGADTKGGLSYVGNDIGLYKYSNG